MTKPLPEITRRLLLAETEIDILATFGRAIHNPRDLDELYRTAYGQIRRAMEVDAAYIALLLPDGSHAQTVFSVDKEVEYDPVDSWPIRADRPIGWVVFHGLPIRFADLYRDGPVRFPAFGPANPSLTFGDETARSRSWMAVPMLVNGSVKGVMNVQSYREDVYGEREERLLTTLASMVAIAVEQATLVGRLEATRTALSAPLIPVDDNLLILPLLGRIDAERLLLIQATLLPLLQGSRFSHVLLDCTAVSAFDLTTATTLRRLIQAVGLLGAHCMLSGIQAEHSAALVAAGLDLSRVAIVRDVQQGVAQARAKGRRR
jgi:anti-anti-sigma regulatory factor